MPVIADSSAVRSERTLAQHQAALTLLQGRVAAPDVARVRWLDLACGRGQILMHLDENFSPHARAKLHYFGYDVKHEYALETERHGAKLALGSLTTKVGDLSDFRALVSGSERFDFVTCTNTVHEVDAQHLAGLLVDALLRLNSDGVLFFYDMERLTSPELGAVPWRHDEVRRVVQALLKSFRSDDYVPEVSRWHHSATTGWNVQISRRFVRASDEQLAAGRDVAVEITYQELRGVLASRLEECRRALEELTKFGAETDVERAEVNRYLNEFWAVSRALRVKS